MSAADTPRPPGAPSARARGWPALPLPPWRLSRIERYVTTQTLMAVGAALAILAAVVMLIDFVDVSLSKGARVDLSIVQILTLTLYKTPAVLLVLFPFAFLFGVLAAFVSFNRRSELVAMRAAGVSAWHFIFPAAAAAFIIGVGTISAVNPLAAYLNGLYERANAGMLEEGKGGAARGDSEIWLRQGDNRTQVVIEAASRDPATSSLRDVSMYVYTRSRKGLEFSRRIDAHVAVLHPGYWQLFDAREATPGEQAAPYQSLTIPSTLDPQNAFSKQPAAASVPFWALPATIRQIESAGFSATAYRVQFHQLLATPLLFAAMSILGAAFSLRLMRLGGLALLSTSGVALGVAVFFFDKFCGSLGKADVLPPFLAAWSTPLLALLAAFTLLCYTEDG